MLCCQMSASNIPQLGAYPSPRLRQIFGRHPSDILLIYLVKSVKIMGENSKARSLTDEGYEKIR